MPCIQTPGSGKTGLVGHPVVMQWNCIGERGGRKLAHMFIVCCLFIVSIPESTAKVRAGGERVAGVMPEKTV